MGNRLGNPLHLLAPQYDGTLACGKHKLRRRRTSDPEKVSCYECRETDAFKQALATKTNAASVKLTHAPNAEPTTACPNALEGALSHLLEVLAEAANAAEGVVKAYAEDAHGSDQHQGPLLEVRLQAERLRIYHRYHSAQLVKVSKNVEVARG